MSALTQDFIKKKKPGDLGIEIEIESTGTWPDGNDDWAVKRDTSLRNQGVEYYLRNPIICNSKKLDKIKRLTESFKGHPIIQDCPRTSIHVHVNILRHTPVQVYTAIATYWLLDNLLVRYCGEEQREGNVFCLRLKDAEAVMPTVINDLQHDQPFSVFHGDFIRYSSQNLNAIRQFGSLEYRAMRGTIDPILIDTWSTELYNLVHRCKRFNTPDQMLDAYLDLGPDIFLKNIFSEDFVRTLFLFGGPELIKENIGIISEMCYYHDWQKYEDMINTTLKRQKESRSTAINWEQMEIPR